MVVGEIEVARAVTARGVDTVLVVDPGDTAVLVGSMGPGRLALLVADPADPASVAAAAEMDSELFGPRA